MAGVATIAVSAFSKENGSVYWLWCFYGHFSHLGLSVAGRFCAGALVFSAQGAFLCRCQHQSAPHDSPHFVFKLRNGQLYAGCRFLAG